MSKTKEQIASDLEDFLDKINNFKEIVPALPDVEQVKTLTETFEAINKIAEELPRISQGLINLDKLKDKMRESKPALDGMKKAMVDNRRNYEEFKDFFGRYSRDMENIQNIINDLKALRTQD